MTDPDETPQQPVHATERQAFGPWPLRMFPAYRRRHYRRFAGQVLGIPEDQLDDTIRAARALVRSPSDNVEDDAERDEALRILATLVQLTTPAPSSPVPAMAAGAVIGIATFVATGIGAGLLFGESAEHGLTLATKEVSGERFVRCTWGDWNRATDAERNFIAITFSASLPLDVGTILARLEEMVQPSDGDDVLVAKLMVRLMRDETERAAADLAAVRAAFAGEGHDAADRAEAALTLARVAPPRDEPGGSFLGRWHFPEDAGRLALNVEVMVREGGLELREVVDGEASDWQPVAASDQGTMVRLEGAAAEGVVPTYVISRDDLAMTLSEGFARPHGAAVPVGEIRVGRLVLRGRAWRHEAIRRLR